MSGGRPRKVRSQATCGVGGRDFTQAERAQIIALCEYYGLDAEDDATTAELLEMLHRAYGSYVATEEAFSLQVGVADELTDLDTLLSRSRKVLSLLNQEADRTDGRGCLRAAAELTESLHRFPNLIDAQTTHWPDRRDFVHARRELQLGVVRVRWWEIHRKSLIADLELLIDFCERIGPPKGFGKRTRSARHMFQRELARIYSERLHPLRHERWKSTPKRDANDPPPPHSKTSFARAVMKILGVAFEVKGVSG